MLEETFIIKNDAGLHARVASELRQMIGSYEGTVDFETNGKIASGKSVLMLMALGAKKGSKVRVIIKGQEEQKMYEVLKSYFDRGFNEL